jgi:hypothetical protein
MWSTFSDECSQADRDAAVTFRCFVTMLTQVAVSADFVVRASAGAADVANETRETAAKATKVKPTVVFRSLRSMAL